MAELPKLEKKKWVSQFERIVFERPRLLANRHPAARDEFDGPDGRTTGMNEKFSTPSILQQTCGLGVSRPTARQVTISPTPTS